MRNFLRILFSAAFLLALTAVPAFAQTKIGTIDLKKIFDNYYKTKLATQAIQDRADNMDKDYTSMADDLKKRGDEYEQLLQSADDPAISDQVRAQRKQQADDDYKKLQDSKLAIDQFERQAQMTLADQKQRMRDNILDEIKKVVADKAKAAGYTLVVDTDAETVNGTPAVLYTSGDNDLTDAVLKQLNAGAPVDLPELSTPSPILMSTNTLPYDNSGVPSSNP